MGERLEQMARTDISTVDGHVPDCELLVSDVHGNVTWQRYIQQTSRSQLILNMYLH